MRRSGECDYINTRSFYPRKFLVLSTSRYFKGLTHKKGFDLIGLSFKIQSRIEFLESLTRPKKTLDIFCRDVPQVSIYKFQAKHFPMSLYI